MTMMITISMKTHTIGFLTPCCDDDDDDDDDDGDDDDDDEYENVMIPVHLPRK